MRPFAASHCDRDDQQRRHGRAGAEEPVCAGLALADRAAGARVPPQGSDQRHEFLLWTAAVGWQRRCLQLWSVWRDGRPRAVRAIEAAQCFRVGVTPSAKEILGPLRAATPPCTTPTASAMMSFTGGNSEQSAFLQCVCDRPLLVVG